MKNNSGNVYDRLAKSSPQILNSRALDISSIALTTLSAIATAYVNAMAHKEVIGILASIGLAILIFCVVEGTLLISNHGLLSCYTNNRQRMWASVAYWIIKCAMWLNIAILCCKLGKYPLPLWLDMWNRWSIAVHAAIGLILIDLIRNNDSVKQHRMSELRSQTAERDVLTARMLNSYGSGLIWASSLRGKLDGIFGALKILRDKSEFPEKIRDAVQNLVKEHLQNTFRSGPRNVLQNNSQNVRLVGPSPLQGTYRTSTPKKKKDKSTSGADLSHLKNNPEVRWEKKTRGGYEAWYVPGGNAKRSAQKYLGYVGKRTLKEWNTRNVSQSEIEKWIDERMKEKAV